MTAGPSNVIRAIGAGSSSCGAGATNTRLPGVGDAIGEVTSAPMAAGRIAAGDGADGTDIVQLTVRQLVAVPRGAMRAAEDVLKLARRASRAATRDLAEAVVRDHSWSAVNCPLIWSAAGGEASHAVVDWLASVASGCLVSFAPGVDGPVIIQSIWSAIRSGFRSLGIATREDLVAWLVAQGLISAAEHMRPGAYLHAMVQASVLDAAFGADGGLAGVDSPLSKALVELTLHLSSIPVVHEYLQRAPRQSESHRNCNDAESRGAGRIASSQASTEAGLAADMQRLDFDERMDDGGPLVESNACVSGSAAAPASRRRRVEGGGYAVVPPPGELSSDDECIGHNR